MLTLAPTAAGQNASLARIIDGVAQLTITNQRVGGEAALSFVGDNGCARSARRATTTDDHDLGFDIGVKPVLHQRLGAAVMASRRH